MKKISLLLLLACAMFSCSKNEKAASGAVCTINGRYVSAPDGTVLYMTAVDDIQVPLDSAVVKGGHFGFELSDTAVAVRFISSQVVVDGGFVVVEPGVVDVDFTGDVFVKGTGSNERLDRFMAEKEKIINLRRMGSPEILDELALDEAMCDSIRELVTLAGDIFDAYALKEISENMGTPVGYFYIVQSVGVVTPSKLQPMIDKVPVAFRDKLYDAVKKRVDTEARESAMADKYLEDIWQGLAATAVGKDFQNFELDNIKGGKVLLSDEVLSNRYTILVFWAGWENGAKEFLASLSALYDRYRGDGLQMVGVSLDATVAACEALVDELGVTWLQLCDPTSGSAEVAAAYGISELPATVLINNRGTIIARMSTIADVEKKLEELF